MKPFYYTTSTNFGDHMNSWLWPALVPEMLSREDDTRLVGVGSLLSRNLDLVPGRKIVFGTGSGYSSLPEADQVQAWKVYAVRGPLTARFLGLDPSLAVTDGAWLINQVPAYSSIPTSRRGTVFVPHWTSAKFGNWSGICEAADVTFVDPLRDCSEVFAAIAGAELALVESLHGAIIADYYRTPWIPLVTPDRILKFKWLDWCGSLDLDYTPYHLPPSDYVDALLQRRLTGEIETGLNVIDVPNDTYDVPATRPPPPKASSAYFAKRRLRNRMRRLRDFGTERLADLRESFVFRQWNNRHSEKMTTYFKQLSGVRPCLSNNDIRDDRIERLNGALDQMRRDFQADRI